ncbi:MAG TPA: hypothetical protein VF173_17310 [Thermoanaerobaculia bacterium]|nr:hypothetical protein [Thermoanaerobaculia bacterium]
MTRIRSAFIVLTLALAVAVPALAQPITVAWGNDGWQTAANSSQIDLSIYPLAGLFGAGATFSPTVVSLSGSPLDSTNLGSIDTLLERPAPSVTYTTYPETHTFPVALKAMRLRGTVTVIPSGGSPTTYTLTVAVSEAGSGSGTITATRDQPDGGHFDSSFPVQPKLVFVSGSSRLELDCGYTSACPTNITLSSTNNCWVVAHGPNNFDPASKGITNILAGIAVDGTFDGTNDYTTVGKKPAAATGLEFHPGYNPVPPFNVCTDVVHTHAVYSLHHQTKPPADCATTRSGLTGTVGSGGVFTSKAYCLGIADHPTQPGPVETTPTPIHDSGNN